MLSTTLHEPFMAQEIIPRALTDTALGHSSSTLCCSQEEQSNTPHLRPSTVSKPSLNMALLDKGVSTSHSLNLDTMCIELFHYPSHTLFSAAVTCRARNCIYLPYRPPSFPPTTVYNAPTTQTSTSHYTTNANQNKHEPSTERKHRAVTLSGLPFIATHERSRQVHPRHRRASHPPRSGSRATAEVWG
jgi:hypothetical protein